MPKLDTPTDTINKLWLQDRLDRLDHIRNQLGYVVDDVKVLKKSLGRRGGHGIPLDKNEEGLHPQDIQEMVEKIEAHCAIMKDLAIYLQGIEWILGRTVQEFERTEQ